MGVRIQRFRGGLVFKAQRLCVSVNSRLESNKEEEKIQDVEFGMEGHSHSVSRSVTTDPRKGPGRFRVEGSGFRLLGSQKGFNHGEWSVRRVVVVSDSSPDFQTNGVEERN